MGTLEGDVLFQKPVVPKISAISFSLDKADRTAKVCYITHYLRPRLKQATSRESLAELDAFIYSERIFKSHILFANKSSNVFHFTYRPKSLLG